MTKISVIIPVYNNEKFLRKCLDSLCNQTLEDIEIICIDNDSKDASAEIIKEYAEKDPRVNLLVCEKDDSEKSIGPSKARNMGLEFATGEYIGFMDSDDWVDLDYFEKLYSAAIKYDADISVSGIKRLRSYKWKYHFQIKKEEFITDTNEKFLKCQIPEKCYIWNKIYRASKIRENNLRFEEGIFYEDKIFTPEIIYYLGGLVTVPDTYYNYWTNSGSVVKTKSEKKDRDKQYAEEKMREFLTEKNVDISHHYISIKRHKFLGIRYLRVDEFVDKKRYIFFNLFTIERKC